MSDDIHTRTIKEQRSIIGGTGAWLRRDGDNITIDYDYAGRVTKDDQHFYVDDIAKLARFIEETNP